MAGVKVQGKRRAFRYATFRAYCRVSKGTPITATVFPAISPYLKAWLYGWLPLSDAYGIVFRQIYRRDLLYVCPQYRIESDIHKVSPYRKTIFVYMPEISLPKVLHFRLFCVNLQPWREGSARQRSVMLYTCEVET